MDLQPETPHELRARIAAAAQQQYEGDLTASYQVAHPEFFGERIASVVLDVLADGAHRDLVKVRLSAIQNCLTMGSYMTGGNLAFLELLDLLGIKEHELPDFEPGWRRLPEIGQSQP